MAEGGIQPTGSATNPALSAGDAPIRSPLGVNVKGDAPGRSPLGVKEIISTDTPSWKRELAERKKKKVQSTPSKSDPLANVATNWQTQLQQKRKAVQSPEGDVKASSESKVPEWVIQAEQRRNRLDKKDISGDQDLSGAPTQAVITHSDTGEDEATQACGIDESGADTEDMDAPTQAVVKDSMSDTERPKLDRNASQAGVEDSESDSDGPKDFSVPQASVQLEEKYNEPDVKMVGYNMDVGDQKGSSGKAAPIEPTCGPTLAYSLDTENASKSSKSDKVTDSTLADYLGAEIGGKKEGTGSTQSFSASKDEEEEKEEKEEEEEMDEEGVGNDNQPSKGSIIINVTGLTGGKVANLNQVGYVAEQHLHVQGDELVPTLKVRTQEKLKSQTEGMIKMSAVDLVMKKLQDGQKWITITGNAGEGKTTMGYMILKALERETVFIVDTPEEFSNVYKVQKGCTILLNDIFGPFSLDLSSMNIWIHQIANVFEDHEKSARRGKQTRIIFISRWNVLQSAKDHLERIGTKILDPECVINLSTSSVKTERIQLLDCYLSNDLSIDSYVKNRIADMDTPHGFPHCCKMYAELKSRGEDIDIKAFFKSPLQFLDKTTGVLVTKQECLDLFMEIIKNDGHLNPLKIKDDKERRLVNKAALELNGSYIKKMSGHFMFTHPSIHESVVNVIGKTDSLFIVKYASVSLIMQMVNIKDNSGDEEKQGETDVLADQVDIDPLPEVLDVLCDRFRDQILKKDFSVFRHKFCDNLYFCERLVSNCVEKCQSSKRQNNEGQPSCDEITSGETISVNEVDRSRCPMLHRAVMGGRFTAVAVLLKYGADVNVTGGMGSTALHHLCASGKADTSSLQLLITHGVDMSSTDENGRTALYYLCANGKADTSTVQLLIQHGVDVNQADRYGMTALHHLCENGKIYTNTLQLLIKHGASVKEANSYGRTALHYLCRSGRANASTVQLLLNYGVDVNRADRYGMTALHHLCDIGKAESLLQFQPTFVHMDEAHHTHLWGSGKVDTFALDILRSHGRFDNRRDVNGMTALHHLCRSGKATFRTVDALLYPYVFPILVDNFMKTPLDYLRKHGKVDADIVQLLTKKLPTHFV